ncbi:MAG: hypothetical protein KC543_01495, partial [Myxococcales bacterium]|nr:hypothetical protein [Myxococcales bacterium]
MARLWVQAVMVGGGKRRWTWGGISAIALAAIAAGVVVVALREARVGASGGRGASGAPVGSAAAPHVTPLVASLPTGPGPFAPSEVRVEGPTDPATIADLADTARCIQCHADAGHQWSASAHAHASFNNPWYRVAVDRFRAEQGPRASRFCAGCHEPWLLLTGKMDHEVVAPDDPLSHAGITCGVCHSIRSVRPDGNGSYTLSTAPIPLPDPADPDSIAAHRARVASDALRTGALCGSCHRSFLGPDTGNPHRIVGIDDLGAWRASPHAGSDAARLDTVGDAAASAGRATCQTCHMPPRPAPRGDMAASDGDLASHRWAGSHTSLAAALDDPEQMAAERASLVGAARVDIAAARVDGDLFLPADGAPIAPGASVELDVVVRNERTGHRFPGGTRDLGDTWIEVRVRDIAGRPVAQSGVAYRRAATFDPSAFRFRSVLADAAGVPEERHFVERFNAPLYDRTLAARDAIVVRYALDLPRRRAVRRGLRVEARLLHRRHTPALHRAACAATRTARGAAF